MRQPKSFQSNHYIPNAGILSSHDGQNTSCSHSMNPFSTSPLWIHRVCSLAQTRSIDSSHEDKKISGRPILVVITEPTCKGAYSNEKPILNESLIAIQTEFNFIGH